MKIQKDVKEIFDIVKNNGHKVYLVGGCVRDYLLNKSPHDYDFCTDAKPDEIIRIFSHAGYDVLTTGLQYGTVTVIVDTISYEITTFRIESNYSDGRHPDNVTFTDDLVKDLSRRDFTMNAIAWSPETGYVDPFDGIEDIKKKVIRCVGIPEMRYEEDPLRMLRLVRFKAQLGFSLNTFSEYPVGAKEWVEKLSHISSERIMIEFSKIIESENPAEIMNYPLLFQQCIPSVKPILQCRQNNPYHCYDVYHHTLMALQAEPTGDLITRLAILFHDVGKDECKTTDDYGIDHFYKHAVRSESMAYHFLTDMKFNNKTRDSVCELIRYHDAMFEDKKKTVKRMLNLIGEEQFRRLLVVRYCDIMAQNQKYLYARLQKVFYIQKILDEVIADEECFSLNDLDINGNDLMEHFHLMPGKNVGFILNKILKEVIAGDLKNNFQDLIFRARQIFDEMV